MTWYDDRRRALEAIWAWFAATFAAIALVSGLLAIWQESWQWASTALLLGVAAFISAMAGDLR